MRDGFRQGAQRLILRVIRRRSQQAEHEQVVVDATESEPLSRLIKACSLHVLGELNFIEVFIRLYTHINASIAQK